MTTTPTTYTVEVLSWMYPIKPANDPKTTYYCMGRVVNLPRETFAVTRAGNGATLFYCREHNRVFGLKEDACEVCRALLPQQVQDANLEASVTPL